MSATAEASAASSSIDWKPLLFVCYREGKKTRIADLRGPEWPVATESPLNALFARRTRLWEEKTIDLGIRDGMPEGVRIVRDYGDRKGTAFIPWCDVLALEYQGEVLPEDAADLPFPR